MKLIKFPIRLGAEYDPPYLAINPRYVRSISPFDEESCYISIEGHQYSAMIALPFDVVFEKLQEAA